MWYNQYKLCFIMILSQSLSGWLWLSGGTLRSDVSLRFHFLHSSKHWRRFWPQFKSRPFHCRGRFELSNGGNVDHLWWLNPSNVYKRWKRWESSRPWKPHIRDVEVWQIDDPEARLSGRRRQQRWGWLNRVMFRETLTGIGACINSRQ
jgi:hypothetical protein